jgi:hypothetical protein
LWDFYDATADEGITSFSEINQSELAAKAGYALRV